MDLINDIMVKDDRHSFPLSVRVRRIELDDYDNAVIDFGYGASYYLTDLFNPNQNYGLQFKEEDATFCLDISGRNFFGSPVYVKVKDILDIPEIKIFLEYLNKFNPEKEEFNNIDLIDSTVDQFMLVQDDNSTENDVILNIGDISAFVYCSETEIWNLQMKSGTYLSLKISTRNYGKYLERIKEFLIKRNEDSFYYCEHHLFLIVIKTLALVKFKDSKIYLHLKNGKYLIIEATLKSYHLLLPNLEKKLKGNQE